MNITEELKKLSLETGPSGFEFPVSEKCMQILAPYVDEVSCTELGNVIAIKRCGLENAKKLMLIAHIDEIGLIVTGYDEGFLRFASIGGVDRRMLPARELTILTEPPLFGVVGAAAPHGLSASAMTESIPMEDLRIDTGLSGAEVKKKIPVGTPVSFRSPFFMLGDDTVCGKSFDDRACFMGIAKAAELLQDARLPWDVYFVGSISEELGMRGAVTAAYRIDPDVCIAVDVCHAWTPDVAPKDFVSELGKGPTVTVGPNTCPAVVRRLRALADEKRIPYQIDVAGGNTGTDAWTVQISREGVATAVLSLPLRYMHTPQEAGSLKDMGLLAELAAAFARDPGEEVLSCLNI